MGDHVARQLCQVYMFKREFHLSDICAREGQETVHQAPQPVRFLQHTANNLAVGSLVAVFAEPHFADAANRSQRCAEFVGGVGRKTVQLLKKRSRRAKVSLKTMAKRPSSSSGFTTGNCSPESLCRDGSRLVSHLAHRRQSPPRQSIATDCQRPQQPRGSRSLRQVVVHSARGEAAPQTWLPG